MAGKRPDWVTPPAHLSDSPPVPAPEEVTTSEEQDVKDRLEPTRYGDWERAGICRDF